MLRILLLADPMASPFGTRLRTFLLKTIINRFLYAKTPSGFESLLSTKKEDT